MTLACGIDVGGTKIAGGVVDDTGKVLEELRVESPATDAHAIEAAIERLVAELRARHEIEAVGVGAAGYIDKSRSVVLFAPNLAWRDLDLKADLEATLGLPVVVENDANAAAWGEYHFGAGRNETFLVCVTIGTGIGGGVIVDGELFRGGFGIGAEFGHIQMVEDGRQCPCGQRGCWEQYGSGNALVRDARRRAGQALENAGQGLADLAAVLDPETFIVGGGVSEAGDLFLKPTIAAFEARLTGGGHRPVASVEMAQLGNDAGLVGAADLARRR